MIEAVVMSASLAISIAIVPLVRVIPRLIQRFRHRREWQKFIQKMDAGKAAEILNNTNLNPSKAARILDEAFQYLERKNRGERAEGNEPRKNRR